MKKCSFCHEIKPLCDFQKKSNQKDGYHYYCAICSRKFSRENKYRMRYGITLKDKYKMIDDQNGGCAICGLTLTDKQACVDHNHETNQVRDILCQNCNKGLGSFLDDPDILEKAKQYLLKWTV